ncbi:MAG: O-antigen ligase family protein [Leptospira sp.]|uniref:O-antigen ligase family protein n=1 Tax=Leptospira sp. TaxID=178 RepID=UPI0025BD4756|nr:O-antigen ligase family protein [Leptospira sp.]MBL0955146.1 O-antigen ligase family protein [Leptospira sp.]
MIGKETFHKVSYVFLWLFLAFSPFSISLSQIFAGLSLFFLFLHQIKNKELPKFPNALLFWIGLYVSFLIFPLIEFQEIHWKKDIVKSEFGDLWMAFLLLHQTSLTNLQKKKLQKAVLLGAIFLILSGLVSCFFHYRLAPYVMDGFRYIEGKRLPHLLAILHGISIYLPIGFQSTHLTYGGLLALYLPSVLEKTVVLFQKKKIRIHLWKVSLLFFSFSLLGILLLFLNQSRSIWIGFLFSSILLYQNKKPSLKKILPWLVFGIFLILAIFISFYHTNWIFQRAIDDIFTKRSLENQRIWIHKINFILVRENFLFGIGAGNYGERFIDSAIPIIDQFPELYYDLFITPKSHAHFDFFHDILLGGCFAFIFFLSFLWVICKQIESTQNQFLFSIGIFVVLLAGSFQCYLLDDEVLLPFMGLLSILPQLRKNKFDFQSTIKDQLEKSSKTFFLNRNFIPVSFGMILLWLFSSLTVTYLWSQMEDKDLVIHRTRTKDNFPSPFSQMSIGAETPIPLPGSPKEWYFKLSGCLDKELNFRTEPVVRKKPIQVKILWDKEFEKHLPKSILVEIRKRESFDQDKEYRVHGERILKTSSLPITGNDHLVSVDPSDMLQGIPEFVDFGFWYEWEGNEPYLPRIQITGNCE